MIYTLSQEAKSEAVRLNASGDILDRAGYFVDKTITEQSEKLPTPILGGRSLIKPTNIFRISNNLLQ